MICTTIKGTRNMIVYDLYYMKGTRNMKLYDLYYYKGNQEYDSI